MKCSVVDAALFLAALRAPLVGAALGDVCLRKSNGHRTAFMFAFMDVIDLNLRFAPMGRVLTDWSDWFRRIRGGRCSAGGALRAGCFRRDSDHRNSA